MNINLKVAGKKYGAYLVAVVVFVVAALVYCSPVLSDKKINADDSQRFMAASAESRNYSAQTGDYTWWTGSMFCGMPNYQVGGGHFKSDDLLAPAVSLLQKGVNGTVWKLILYFLCFFILFRCFGVDKWLSIAGGLATGLSSYFLVIIPAGHNTKAATIALIAVVVGGFYLIFRKKYALGAVLTMLFTAAGFDLHPQMFYYYCMLIGVLWIAELFIHIKDRRWKDLVLATVVFALSLGIGVGTGSANVFANAEYVEQTQRGGSSDLSSEGVNNKGLDLNYATQWSYGIDETMSLMIPGFKGGSSTGRLGQNSQLYKTLRSKGVGASDAKKFCSRVPLYWGDQPFTSGNVYVGAVICFLFLLGLLVVKGPYKWALLVATLFSILLAWGHNFLPLTEFFFKYFPMYSKFRAVSSILIVAEVTMPLLGFLAIKDIMDGKVDKDKVSRSVLISAAVTGGLCLLFAVFGRAFFDFSSPVSDSRLAQAFPDWLFSAIIEQRASLFVSDSFRSALFIAGAALTIWLYAKGKLKSVWMISIIGVLSVVDLWQVDRRYFNDDNFVPAHVEGNFLKMYDYEKEILQDPDPNFRVFNTTVNTFNDARTSCYLKSIGGYSAAKLRRYQDLVNVYLSDGDRDILNMLNTKYFIIKDDDGSIVPVMNEEALGNAWFVDRVIAVDTPDEEMAMLGRIDLQNTAVTDRNFENFVVESNPGESSVALLSYSPKKLEYVCDSENGGTVVFSEIYYPYGWKASIDGKPAEHFRANYTLRALNVPAGRHTVGFVFDPDSIRKGETVATIFIILMYLAIAGAIVYGVLKWRRCR